MANWLHRTTKEFLSSVSPASLPEPQVNYIESPDLSAVSGFPNIYWIITGDVISLINSVSRDAVDVQIAADALTADRDRNKTRLSGEKVLKAVVLVMIDEINLLRAQHSLSARTPSQAITAVENKIESLS